MDRKPHLYTILILAGAALGLFFAGFSTTDFAQHLDRQEHSVSCSFTPGLSKAEAGKSDCKTTMMSEYSSIMRTRVWGGVPISLPAMSVFAFLLLFAVELILTGRQEDPRAAGFMALATALPAVTSGVMAFISFSKLDAACKLCIGIYLASLIVVLGGVLLWRRAVELARGHEIRGIETAGTAAAGYDARVTRQGVAPARRDEHGDPAFAGGPAPAAPVEPELEDVPPRPPGRVAAGGSSLRPASPTWGYLGAAFGLGVLLVVVPVFAYAKMAPDHSSFIGTCGQLVEAKDPYGVMVPIDQHSGGATAIEVFDPLCPACRAFERRLVSSELDKELDRVALLFPLDSECNWMVSDRTHPGACAVSEAILCAGERAPQVIQWAFDNQEALKAASAASGDGARQMARARFPDLASCIGSEVAKQKLNKSLRLGVRNQLATYTPQLFIDGVKLCDEDTDLGLEYQLTRMLERRRSGTLRSTTPPPAAAPQPTAVPEAPAATTPPP
ncbi:MAG TPA: vitamin K epoxide reductase family protein, partial [Kofleriaceae bacterium]|nr:vitamin K epoxide reductase family protein [Kofleriaceae bacterium]